MNIITDRECRNCKQVKKHFAKGLCQYCYKRLKYGDKLKETAKKFLDKHPNYFKNYYKKRKDLIKLNKEKN